MRKRFPPAATSFVLAGALLISCGGKTVDFGPARDAGDASSSGGSSSGGSSGSTSSSGGSSGGSSSGSSSGGSSSSSGGTSCVFVDLSTYDRSCQFNSDCIDVLSGEVCSGDCYCNGGVPVSSYELGRFQQAVSSIEFGQCGCPAAPGGPQCVDGMCAPESNSVDASAPDAGHCVDIDLSTYDTSCKVDSDCIDVTAGPLCSGQCSCGGSTINIDGAARYDAALSTVTLAACPCTSDGPLRCLQNRCTLCGFGPDNPPGCNDDGG